MKTHAANPNSFHTNSPYAHEETPKLPEGPAAASTSGTHQPLGRPPSKRRRVESDDRGAPTRYGQPSAASAVKKSKPMPAKARGTGAFSSGSRLPSKTSASEPSGIRTGSPLTSARRQRIIGHNDRRSMVWRQEHLFDRVNNRPNGPPESDHVKSRRHPGSQSGHSMAWG